MDSKLFGAIQLICSVSINNYDAILMQYYTFTTCPDCGTAHLPHLHSQLPMPNTQHVRPRQPDPQLSLTSPPDGIP